jgi:hypothetical protein
MKRSHFTGIDVHCQFCEIAVLNPAVHDRFLFKACIYRTSRTVHGEPFKGTQVVVWDIAYLPGAARAQSCSSSGKHAQEPSAAAYCLAARPPRRGRMPIARLRIPSRSDQLQPIVISSKVAVTVGSVVMNVTR